ncbi:MAG TPA: mannonate dehydratase [Acidobacteriaceae bacterium]|jgi:mannonate dehydratase
MEQTWRWFGPHDKVTLRDAGHAGAEGIVTALHDIPVGTAWPVEAIRKRQMEIAAAGLRWSVVESLDVSEAIKLRAPGFQDHIDAFIESLRNLAACGIRTVAYNFMPVFSWMRTDLHVPLPMSIYAVGFDAIAFAAFDLFMLQRPAAEAEWGEARIRAAKTYYDALSAGQRDHLQATVLQGLPGGNRAFTVSEAHALLEAYRDVDDTAFRGNAGEFLRAVCPVAQELGIQLCVHPDDPPRSLFGLPRIISTADDLAWLLEQSPEASNAITFCTGALGVRADNDLVAMARRFAHRIGFVHLRSTQRLPAAAEYDPPVESFVEAAHLEGDADLIGVMGELVREERRRRAAGDPHPLPFRPDHGQELLDDRDRAAQAGYPAVGRLRGLAELRGVLKTTERLLDKG